MRAIGLDVHRDFCEVAIAEAGKVRSAGRVATRPEALELFAQSLAADDVVALEATTGNACEIVADHRAARDRGWSWPTPEADTAISEARAKTDRLDARTLARAAGGGVAGQVWTPDERTRVMRRRLARRRSSWCGAHARQEREPRRS